MKARRRKRDSSKQLEEFRILGITAKGDENYHSDSNNLQSRP